MYAADITCQNRGEKECANIYSLKCSSCCLYLCEGCLETTCAEHHPLTKSKDVRDEESTFIFIATHNNYISVSQTVNKRLIRFPCEQHCDCLYPDEAGFFMIHSKIFGYRPGIRGTMYFNYSFVVILSYYQLLINYL